MLLNVVCEKLVLLCSKVIEQYQSQIESERRTGGAGVDWKNRILSLGEYEVSSQREWSCLIRALSILHLQCLGEFLGEMKGVSSFTLPQSQYSKLLAEEEKVKELCKRMTE